MAKRVASAMNKIYHDGIVESSHNGCVKVLITQTAACASCKIAKHCNASEAKEKIIDVYVNNADDFAPGDHVTVSMSAGNSYHAVMLAFGVPLIVMVAVILLVYLWTKDEGLAAVVGVASLLPYYLVLYLIRDKLSRKYAFVIKKISN